MTHQYTLSAEISVKIKLRQGATGKIGILKVDVSFVIKLQASRLKHIEKEIKSRRLFPVNFCETFKNTSFTEHLQATAFLFLKHALPA